MHDPDLGHLVGGRALHQLVQAAPGGFQALELRMVIHAVQQLVLINSVGYTNGPAFSKFLFPPFDYLAVEYLRQRKIQALNFGSALGNLDATTLEAIRCAALHQEMPGWHEAMISYAKSGGYDIADKIAQVDLPTLILWGEADDMLDIGDAEKFQQAIAHSQLHKLNCGHVPQLEQPQITASHILEFRQKS